MKRVRHLDDLYSWEQIRKLCNVRASNQLNGFVPVAFIAQGEGYHALYGGSSGRGDHFEWYGKSTAHYAWTLWNAVRRELMASENKVLSYDVVPASECFNTIRYKDPAAAGAYTQRFWSLLEEFSDSGRFKAIVGKIPMENVPCALGRPSSAVVIADGDEYKPHEAHLSVPAYGEMGSPGWKCIREYFTELSAAELAFLNGDDLMNREPSEADKALFDACNHLDVEALSAALAVGANPNAFSERKWGETAGQCLFSSVGYPITDEQFNKVCKAVSILVEYGCDLDLCPYGGGNALWDAGYVSSRCVQLLLDKGVDANTVCWISASDGDMATAFDHVSWDIAADGPEPDLLEMEKVLDARGGKHFSELVPEFYA